MLGILRRIWQYRLWWEVWIALLIFCWVTGALQAEVLTGLASILLLPSAIALLWRGAFGLETPSGLQKLGSIVLALLLIGVVPRILLEAPTALATWLADGNIEVDPDILDVFFLVITATIGAGILWLLIAHPSTMHKVANPKGRLALIAADPHVLRLVGLTWLLGLIALALVPAALKASWVPNVSASIVVPIAILLIREDRSKWIEEVSGTARSATYRQSQAGKPIGKV